jgi:tRNA threonylcarbamoyladenosine biosynthesis protein TsaE
LAAGGSTSVSILSGSPAETEAIAAGLAERLEAGDVVTVAGELGSGKTTFVRGACRGLGVEQPVTSPTFTIGHRYRGRIDVSHLDLYRYAGVSPAEWGDLEPYFDDAVVFVEWPEAGAGTLPVPRVRVTLDHVDPARRRVRLDAAESALLEGLERADPGVRHGHRRGD